MFSCCVVLDCVANYSQTNCHPCLWMTSHFSTHVSRDCIWNPRAFEASIFVNDTCISVLAALLKWAKMEVLCYRCHLTVTCTSPNLQSTNTDQLAPHCSRSISSVCLLPSHMRYWLSKREIHTFKLYRCPCYKCKFMKCV